MVQSVEMMTRMVELPGEPTFMTMAALLLDSSRSSGRNTLSLLPTVTGSVSSSVELSTLRLLLPGSIFCNENRTLGIRKETFNSVSKIVLEIRAVLVSILVILHCCVAAAHTAQIDTYCVLFLLL